MLEFAILMNKVRRSRLAHYFPASILKSEAGKGGNKRVLKGSLYQTRGKAKYAVKQTIRP